MNAFKWLYAVLSITQLPAPPDLLLRNNGMLGLGPLGVNWRSILRKDPNVEPMIVVDVAYVIQGVHAINKATAPRCRRPEAVV